jgi:prephenate dehydrogenase
MEGIFDEMAPHLRPGTVVTDTASTKASVIRWANEHLPRSVHFVGGHPMAGKEQSGPLAAEATLFEGRPYVIIPSVNAAVGAVNAVIGLAQAIGAQPSFLDAEEHDAYAAAISHVPLVSSIALFNLARTSAAWPELAGMAGPGFRDLTRLASGEPAMAHDICLTNKENILHWIDRYTAELGRMRELIQGSDAEALFRTIAEAQMERDTFLEKPPRREEPGAQTEIPSAGDAFMGMMGGILWQNRATDMQKTMDERRERELREDRLRRRD